MASVLDSIVSFVDGRVRLRHTALKDAAMAQMAVSVVSGVEGITFVKANPATGSLLIHYNPEQLTREQLLVLAEQGMAFFPEESLKEKASRQDICSALFGRKANRFVDRAMLVSLIATLAALPLGNRTVHTAAGGVLVGGLVQHLLAHRKAL